MSNCWYCDHIVSPSSRRCPNCGDDDPHYVPSKVVFSPEEMESIERRANAKNFWWSVVSLVVFVVIPATVIEGVLRFFSSDQYGLWNLIVDILLFIWGIIIGIFAFIFGFINALFFTPR